MPAPPVGRAAAHSASDHPEPVPNAAATAGGYPGAAGHPGSGASSAGHPGVAEPAGGRPRATAVGAPYRPDPETGEPGGSGDYAEAGAARGGRGFAASASEHPGAHAANAGDAGGREHADGEDRGHPAVVPQPGGASGYGVAAAPGWGSTAAAAPTLVEDSTGWSADGDPVPDPGAAPPPQPPQAAAAGRYDPPAPQGDGAKTCVACRAGRVDTDGYCEHCGHAQPRERDHLEEELGSVAAVSDRGLRHHRNEDSFAVAATALPDGSAATVAIVCDGVSSASRPDDASAAAAAAANEALLEALPRGAHPQEAMHEAILAAAAAVNALAPEVSGAQNAPACTLVGAVVSGGLLTIGWVGDSRAYWIPDDRAALPRRLTEDDSWAAQMVAAGLMGEAEAYADVRAHAITGWLGADAYELEPHTASFKPDHDGVVVVCTDGLWNYAESARDMAQVLPEDAAARPLHSAQVLVGHALDGGGHDNVTVAVVPFTAPPNPDSDPGSGSGPNPADPARNPGTDAQAEPQAEADPRTQA
ncbi:protein phosphatase 2C domain-containing protein [Streptomyces goshikiensis]|uniref:protein phosphatase 2C domain-containing protein n=1 Tax=Streptomyces goshikiensis TaxID=1942 RepID=UPI0037D52E25